MQVQFLRKFLKDLNRISRTKDKNKIINTIELIKAAQSLKDMADIKKLSGFDNAYRLRAGSYRIGVFIDGNIVQFARVVHRKEIYKVFP